MLLKYLISSRQALLKCEQHLLGNSTSRHLRKTTMLKSFKRFLEEQSSQPMKELRRNYRALSVSAFSQRNSVNNRLLAVRKSSTVAANTPAVCEQQQHQQNLQTILESSNKTKQIKVDLVPPELPTSAAHLTLTDKREIKLILQRFPKPKNSLNNYYCVLAETKQDKSLRPQPQYKTTTTRRNGNPTWTCTYHLKWPEDIKITASDISKKGASHLAAALILDYLNKQEKLSSDGMPLLHTKDDIKKLKKQKQSEIVLNELTLTNMKNIVEIYQGNMKEVIDRSLEGLESGFGDVEQQQELRDGNVSRWQPPRYLGANKYMSQESMTLPITPYKDAFIELLTNHNCVIVKGEPGCGKSSRIPQYVLESWVKEALCEDQFCRIAVTQPRRIAAISLSDRVSSERKEEVGHIVGYQVRLKSNFQSHTGRILYCTTGILLRHLQSNPNLTKFSHVILDEAHERDVNTDLLMNLLKKALKGNDSLKLVVMSATIDTDTFSEYFDGAPVFSVPGFTHPVRRYFLDELPLDLSKTERMCQSDCPEVVHDNVAKLVKYIHDTKPEGAILVFLPGWENIVKVQKLLESTANMFVCMVHSKLKDSEQHKIFSRPPPGIRKVILSTNIAETSITIDDVVYVIDTGIHKDKIFDVDKGIDVLDNHWISKASASQRAGRAGRCSPGKAYHLYTKEKFNQLQEYSAPKILNSSLTKVVLDSKVLSNNMDAIDFMNSLITPPDVSAVEKAVDELKQLELLDENEKLTPLGRTLADFQLEPNLAKALFNGVVFKCATPIVDIVTLFSGEGDIFGSSNLTKKESVKRVKSEFCKTSDHLALMRVYEKWLELVEENYGSTTVERFCREANLVGHKLEFIRKLKQVHFDYLYNGLYNSLPVSDDFSDNDELVKAVLYSGTGTVLQHRNWDVVKNQLKTNVNVLVTRNNHKATISSESVNFKRNRFPSNFLVYINETRSNIRRTTTVRECSLIPAISVVLFTNKPLELVELEPGQGDDTHVIVAIKNTKLQFLCDKRHAPLLLECKQALDHSYRYLTHQLTCAGEDIPQFLAQWNRVLQNLDKILGEHWIE